MLRALLGGFIESINVGCFAKVKRMNLGVLQLYGTVTDQMDGDCFGVCNF